MRVSWALRVLRAAVFAAVSVTLAAAAHRLGTGTAPQARAEVCGFLAVLAVACPLGGRERSLAGIGVSMLAVQAALHFGFDALRPVSGVLSVHGMSMPAHSGGHPMSGRAAVCHALAALVVSWWLRRGEAAFWFLLRRRAGRLVPALIAWWYTDLTTGPMPASARPSAHCCPVRQAVPRHALSRRGPPCPVPPRVLYA